MTFLETIRCEAGSGLHLEYHQRRLERTSRHFGFNRSFSLGSLIVPPDQQIYRCRFLYSADTFEVQYIPYTPKVFTKLKLISDDHIAYPFKNAERTELERLFEMRGESDDVLITQNGYIRDTTIANIALRIEGRWLTPSQPLLSGTTRERLLDEEAIETAPLSIEDISRSDKIALMNAMIGFVEFDNGIIV